LKKQKRRVLDLSLRKDQAWAFDSYYNLQHAKGDEILRQLKQINTPDKLFACCCDSLISLFHLLSIVSYSTKGMNVDVFVFVAARSDATVTMETHVRPTCRFVSVVISLFADDLVIGTVTMLLLQRCFLARAYGTLVSHHKVDWSRALVD
jgi:hypothetical protein